MIEVVISATCPLVGHSIRDAKFRTHYDAFFIAATHNGERLEGRIGDIGLHAGDTLLLEARPSFVQQQQHIRDFLLPNPRLNLWMYHSGPSTSAKERCLN